MPKRPTPKKRRAKSKGRNQFAVYVDKQIRRLQNRQNSPFAVRASKRGSEGGALKGITKIKA